MKQSPPPAPAVTRRSFLKHGAAVTAAAVAAPTILPQRAKGANSRIAVGFIGMGKMARGHLNTFLRNPGVQVVALNDVESVRLDMAKEAADEYYAGASGQGSYESCAIIRDYRDLCARPDIDGVIISTPNHWHALQAVEAAKQGKDIYLEKPLARTIAECQAVRTATEMYGRILQVGSQQRSNRAFRFACEMVRSGRIGEVQEVLVNVGGPPVECYLPAEPVPEGLDWDFWLGPAPWRPYHSDIAPGVDYGGWPNWREYRDYAGGMMTDFGTHHFDIAQWGLGMDGSGPVEVHPPGGNRDRLTYVYENGVRMYRGGAKDGFAVEFVGTEGRVRVNRGDRLETDPEELRNIPLSPDEVRLYTSDNHVQNWLDCMQTRRPPICTAEIGTSTATVCHIGNIAYWLNRSLKWDPVAERFENDDEANRLIARPMRAPWRLEV